MRRFIATFALLGLVGCGGGGGDDGSGTGQLKLSITDAPVDDATSVVVQFSGVAFKRAGSAPEVVQSLTPSPRQLDLLQYQEGRAALLLDGVTLPAGDYEWIRLIVDNVPNIPDSYLVQTTGEQCELRVPSGAESGLKLNRGFTLPADGSIALTVDFDLRKSVHAPPGQRSGTSACTQGYLLRPTLRIVDDANVGAIAGTVEDALIGAACLPKVYVYSGANVLPDDLEDAGATPDIDPLVVVPVTVQNGAIAHPFRAAFIPPGDYTVAFTCSDDDPATDDVLTFELPKNVTVAPNLITTVTFSAPTS